MGLHLSLNASRLGNWGVACVGRQNPVFHPVQEIDSSAAAAEVQLSALSFDSLMPFSLIFIWCLFFIDFRVFGGFLKGMIIG